MATIIDFTAKRNERTAQQKAQQQEQARQQRVDQKIEQAKQAAANGDVAGVIDNLAAAAEAQESPRWMPAYCDPANEYRGSKYEATANISTREIPALIRADIKAAVSRGQLPKGLKVSVRQESGSMYYAINVRITGLPEGWKVYNREYLRFTNNLQHPPQYPDNWDCVGQSAPLSHIEGGVYAPEVQSCLDTLKDIYNAYQRNNSDSMSDYFDVRYYGDVGIDWKLGQGETWE